MGLFKKKEITKGVGELPELPKLPRLPELLDESDFEKSLPKLPDYSINVNDNEFSKNILKKAISGKKEEMIGADEFVREQMMPEHLEIKPSKLEFPYETENQKHFESRKWIEPKIKKRGEVFIKIEKFEESLKIFELTKNKISEMEKLLANIKELKEKEDRELSHWMVEIQTIKNQTEKVERDIFSRLE